MYWGVCSRHITFLVSRTTVFIRRMTGEGHASRVSKGVTTSKPCWLEKGVSSDKVMVPFWWACKVLSCLRRVWLQDSFNAEAVCKDVTWDSPERSNQNNLYTDSLKPHYVPQICAGICFCKQNKQLQTNHQNSQFLKSNVTDHGWTVLLLWIVIYFSLKKFEGLFWFSEPPRWLDLDHLFICRGVLAEATT